MDEKYSLKNVIEILSLMEGGRKLKPSEMDEVLEEFSEEVFSEKLAQTVGIFPHIKDTFSELVTGNFKTFEHIKGAPHEEKEIFWDLDLYLDRISYKIDKIQNR